MMWIASPAPNVRVVTTETIENGSNVWYTRTCELSPVTNQWVTHPGSTRCTSERDARGVHAQVTDIIRICSKELVA